MGDPITKAEMEELLRNQAREFAGLLKGNNFSGSSSTPTPSPSSSSSGSGIGGLIADTASGSIKLLGSTAEETVKAVAALGTGSYGARDALTSFTNVVSKVAPDFGGIMGKMGGAVLDANDRLRESGKVGVDFAGDLGRANKAVVDSGASQQQFADEMRKNATQYSGAGVTMNKAIENVLGFSRDLQETPAIEMMKKAGTTQNEVAELAMISMKERRGIDLNDKEARQQMLENTIALSGEMNEVARLTGVSRQEQMAKLAKDKENVMVQAELMGMDKDATNRYDMLKTKLGPLGDSVSKLADEIFTGGIRTKEGADRMAALGPAGKAFEQAVLMQKNATTQAQKDAAAAAMEKAKADIAAYQQTEQFRSQIKLDRSSVGDEARKQMAENRELKGRMTAEATATSAAKAEGKPAATPEEIQQARINQVRQDTARVGPDGKPLAGSAISSAVNQFDQRLFQESKVAADLFHQLNTEVGGYIRDSKKLQDQLNPRVKVGGENVRREATKDGTALGAIENTVRDTIRDEIQNLPEPQTGQSAPGVSSTRRSRTTPQSNQQETPQTEEARPVTSTRRRPAEARADGGPVEPGVPYWVGEEGPELVKFDTKSTVVPTDQVPTAGKESAIPSIPDFGSMFADTMPDLSALKDKMPDMSTMFADMVPDLSTLKEKMPDMSTMFGDMVPDTELIKKSLPDFDSLMGDMSASIADSSTAAIDNVKLDAISKVDAAKKETTFDEFGSEVEKKPAPEPTPTPPAPLVAEGATLSDIKEQLVELNTAVLQLIAHSAQTAENSGAAVKATKDLSGNLYT